MYPVGPACSQREPNTWYQQLGLSYQQEHKDLNLTGIICLAHASCIHFKAGQSYSEDDANFESPS